MIKKVNFFDKKLVTEYLGILSAISVITSLILIFFPIKEYYRERIMWISISVLIIIYIVRWHRANKLDIVKLTINNSLLEIKIGNIFEESDLKVIAFNEYFDTVVDNELISERTLNGQYINSKIDNISALDRLIENSEHMIENIKETNVNRKEGKHTRYNLGTVFKYNDYLLTAFSKFDDKNRAYLDLQNYVDFLLKFWDEIDIVYGGSSVSIPLLGSGITRFRGYDRITNQELLELLIWSFKVSRVKFSYSSKITIVIHESQKDKINFYKLKEDC